MTETVFSGRDNPCHGCKKRYTACSDHCVDEEFLKWKAQQETIRKNKQKYYQVWGYTSDEILKNRRR